MRSFFLFFALPLVSMSAVSAENFSKVECKLRGNHEIQKKKTLSSKYKTISSDYIEYTPFGAIRFDLQKPKDYGYSISGFFGAFSIKFDLKKINDEEFKFLVTSFGKDVATIPLNINDTVTPETDFLNIEEPKLSFVTGKDRNKRAVLTSLVTQCKRIP
jgi:hypothetical protein